MASEPRSGPLRFEILAESTTSGARVGRVTTPHGSFETPAFMPVGTQASVKGLLPGLVRDTGAEIILANTYHLMLRPGAEVVAEMGGLAAWSRWRGPMLTDSGGFQVFSLGDINVVDEQGVRFRSHLDGAEVMLTPEKSMAVQRMLGADVIMALDDCPPALAPPAGHADEQVSFDQPPTRPMAPGPARHALADPDAYARRLQAACDRTHRWLDRCVAAHPREGGQALFGIVQGGTDLEQRSRCVDAVASHDLPGYAIGGVAVGEGYAGLKAVVEHTAPRLPRDRPRYLMGVGYERDLWTAIQAGVDMFDCVLPTRNARNANVFTPTGPMRLRNARFREDRSPIDPACDCTACAGGYSRSYLRHLFLAGEMLGPILASLHNLRHFQRLLLDIREGIRENARSFVARWPCLGEDAGDDPSTMV